MIPAMDTEVADAMAAKVGPDLGPAESPPGRSLAELDAATLEIVLVAIEGTSKQLQQVAWTKPLRAAQHEELVRQIGRLNVAGHQVRRFLASMAPAA